MRLPGKGENLGRPQQSVQKKASVSHRSTVDGTGTQIFGQEISAAPRPRE